MSRDSSPARGSGPSKRLREWLIRGGLLAGALAVAVGLFEIVLRVSGIQPDFFAQLDSQVSAQYIPGKKGWNVYPSGRQWVEINSYGYRDHEWTVDKPPGTVRIAFLGDSYIAALEVPEEQRISELIEARLNAECLGAGVSRFEVLNFAVTGYATAQLLDTMKHRAPRFAVDSVLAFFYTGNDLYGNSLELDPEPNRVHYRLAASGALERLPYTIRDNPIKRWLRAHSKTYLFVRGRVKRLAAVHRAMMNLGLMQEIAREGDREAAAEAEPENTVEKLRQMQHLRDVPPAIERAWQLTEALLVALAEEAGKTADLALVTIPTRPELQDAAGTLTLEQPERWDYQQPIRRVAEICVRRGLACLSLVENMTREPDRIPELFFEPGGHWTPYGHRVAAEAVFDLVGRRYCAAQ